MLLLFETPAGYALFKVTDKAKIKNATPEDIMKSFVTPEAASDFVTLTAFKKFEDTQSALAAASAICEGKLDKGLKKFLKANIGDAGKLGVGDVKLATLIKDKLEIKCVYDDTVLELLRGIRQQLDALLPGISQNDRSAMKLGLAHSLCRYKLKFSPDKVDTMIIQAIALLDELDKELNTYAMRVREWYGWHFPEMGKIVTDNIMYAKVVKKMGTRNLCSSTDLSDILPEEVEQELKPAAEVSMGTEISTEDVENISELCEQVIAISEYRAALFEYLRNRMNAIAPNLAIMVGELVGARLVAHAGSLLNLAKHPASTVQILGAEKALFRALKTKHETPKYGLIYHASLVGQAAPKNKGKISRVLAAKTALAARQDALGEETNPTLGLDSRAKVERRLAELEGGVVKSLSGSGKGKANQEKYQKPAAPKSYNPAADAALASNGDANKKKRKDAEDSEEAEQAPAKKAKAAAADDSDDEAPKKAKKDKKRKAEAEAEAPAADADAGAAKEKKKKKKKEAVESD